MQNLRNKTIKILRILFMKNKIKIPLLIIIIIKNQDEYNKTNIIFIIRMFFLINNIINL